MSMKRPMVSHRSRIEVLLSAQTNLADLYENGRDGAGIPADSRQGGTCELQCQVSLELNFNLERSIFRSGVEE